MLLSLLQASIPYSFYNVRAGVNDAIDAMVKNFIGAPPEIFEKALVFPPGNYTAISMAKQFKAQLEDFLLVSSLPSTVTID